MTTPTATTWITSNDALVEHRVTDAAYDEGVNTAVFAALCGAEFASAPLTVGPRGRCGSCRRYQVARESMRDLPDRRRRPSLLPRLLGHPRTPVDAGSAPTPVSAGSSRRRTRWRVA
jgi:hypothetical protein